MKINSVNALYLIFKNFQEFNGNKYLTLVPSNESKEKIIFGELWSKIRDLTKYITKNSDDCDEKYTKLKLISDHELPLNKTIEIVVRAVFHKNNKCYLQVFLDECLYEL